jgi:hypothetical protein
MARKPKTNRVERTHAGGEWTSAGYWGFIRSGLRQMSRRWPPLARQAINAARRKYDGENKRQKWEYQCSTCKCWRNRKQVEVDHIVPCGSLKSLDDLPGFVERLFCEPEGLRVLCDACHALRTEANRLRSIEQTEESE